MPGYEADASREWPAEDALIGKVVNGRFHIVKRIARGGMGSVYFATQSPLSRPVAVKVLHTAGHIQGETEDSFRRRFLQEASILAKVQHPNIVMLFDYGQITNLATEHYFMAMEYLRGETLAQRFRTQGRLSILETIRLARQVGRGLREAHRCGFVHRDLKPSNIMLVPDDERSDIVKLVDFGIGKVIPSGADQVRDSADETQAGLLLGSPRYMSPEQIRSEAVEPRTDLYGLGITLFEALTGRVPFDTGTNFDVMVSHCLVEPPRIEDVCPGQAFPESLSRLVSSLLEKQPTGRPTVDEFLRELTAVEDEIFRNVTLTTGAAPTLATMTLAAGEPPPSGDVESRHRITVRPPAPVSLRSPSGGLDEGQRPSFLPLSPEALPAPRRPWGRITLFAMLVALIPIGRCIVLNRDEMGVASRSVRTPPAGIEAPAVRPDVAPTGAIAHETFELTIDSSPPGARVSEDGRTLGTTPTILSVDRATVTTGPRHFAVDLDGYTTYSVDQGDAEGPVRVMATLTPRRNGKTFPRAVGPFHWGGDVGASAGQGDSARVKHDESTGLDIRLRR